jgi:putative N-acetyltransferase (TIGR04045 family)
MERRQMNIQLDQAVSIGFAKSTPDLAEYFRIRHAVFVAEQGIFSESDIDSRDNALDVLHVLGRYQDTPAGTVRLYPLNQTTGLWQGDRLAVLDEYRAHNIGAPLVRYAVSTAGKQGGSVMVAHIQPANVRFFELLGWSQYGDREIYCGLPHVPMRITLT